jgi:hypothetical protein
MDLEQDGLVRLGGCQGLYPKEQQGCKQKNDERDISLFHSITSQEE